MLVLGTRTEEAESVVELVRAENALAYAILFLGIGYHCSHLVVCEEAGVILGLASYAPFGEDGLGKPTLVGLYTFRAHRRQGVAQRLVRAVIELHAKEMPGTPLHMTAVSQEAAGLIPKLIGLQIVVSNQSLGIQPGFLL